MFDGLQVILQDILVNSYVKRYLYLSGTAKCFVVSWSPLVYAYACEMEVKLLPFVLLSLWCS